MSLLVLGLLLHVLVARICLWYSYVLKVVFLCRHLKMLRIRGGGKADDAAIPSSSSRTPNVDGSNSNGGDGEDSGEMPMMDRAFLKAMRFSDLMGDTLIKGGEKGTVVKTKEAIKGKHVALFFCSKKIEDQLIKQLKSESKRPTTIVNSALKVAKDAGNDVEVSYFFHFSLTLFLDRFFGVIVIHWSFHYD